MGNRYSLLRQYCDNKIVFSCCPSKKIYNTYLKPLKNLNIRNAMNHGVTEDATPKSPSPSNVNTSTILRPLVSARHPQKNEPKIMPNIGAEFIRALLSEVILKSQVAAGKTNDKSVTPIAVFK